jgi:crotonobetainyl-CoA:carnitine CoA-transferase CaiB-like acyl-CoA transferase
MTDRAAHDASTTAPAATAGALAGVRVIDLTTVLMGPFTTQMLGDMGADVVKVESVQGDPVRRVGPARHPGMGAIFLQGNRSKRSLVLDLKQPEGRDAVLRLAEGADVLVYNIRPQAMARLGLTYEEVSAANPRIVYAGMFGYDQRGPYAARPAYDDLIQSLVALPTLAVLAGGDRPRYVPLAIADRYVAAIGVGTILGALLHRAKSGRGQRVDIPMFETMAQMVLGDHMGGRTFEPPLGPPGYKRSLSPERVPYRTRDGYISVLAYNDKQWRSFFAAIGRPELPDGDPRFSDVGSRTVHIDALYALIAEVFSARTTAEWLAILDSADIPAMPLHTLDTLIDDPHLAAVGFLQTTEHPSEGTIRGAGAPTRWSETQAAPGRPAPRLGEHSVEVLCEAGYTGAEIDRLLAAGITADGSTGAPP